ncbi:MAG: sialidase family protein, partial [Planctomycetota bacterium]
MFKQATLDSVLLAGAAVLAASATTAVARPDAGAVVPMVHREQPDDPYAPRILPAGVPDTAPPTRVVRGGFESIQVNVDANGMNIVGDAGNEPSIAVDPTNPNRMVIGWRQFDNVASNFRQAGWGYSHDDGRQWTFPGVIQPGVFRSDPVLAADGDGTIHYYSLTDDFTCDLFRSFDGGLTWQPGIEAFGGDKAWMAIDRTGGAGDGHIYCAWSFAAACCGMDTFTRSPANPFNPPVPSFMVPIAIPLTPVFGTLTVGSDGEVYVAGV